MTRQKTGMLVLVVALLLPGVPGRAQQTVTITEAAQMALDQGRDVRDARLALEVAREQVSEQWGQLYPQIDLSAQYARNFKVAQGFLPAIIFDPDADPNEVVPVRFGSDNAWTSSIDVEQKLFAPGVFVGLGAAGRFESLQSETVRGRRQGAVTRARIAFYNLLLAQEQFRLTDNSVRRVRESLAETRALNRAGLSSDFDVLRLEVELANLEPNLLRSQNAIVESKRELAIEMNVEALEGFSVAGQLAAMDLEDPAANSAANREILAFAGITEVGNRSGEDLVGLARERRSDLRQLELTERLRESELRLEHEARFLEYAADDNYPAGPAGHGRS